MPTSDSFMPLPEQDTYDKTLYSYAIINRGQHPAAIRLEIGPNGTDYAVDLEGTVDKGAMDVVTPSKFMRYTRLSVKSGEKGKPTKLQIYFQAQLAR